MNLQRLWIPVFAAGLLVLAHRQYGWLGVAAVSGGLVMWLLMHITRLLTVMQRAARRPLGYVDSAVMLNAKLKSGVTLRWAPAQLDAAPARGRHDRSLRRLAGRQGAAPGS